MTALRKRDIVRPDRRIAVTIETLAFLLDVSTQTIRNAVAKGVMPGPKEMLGMRLFHVETVERALFGTLAADLGEPESAAPDSDPAMMGLARLDGPKANKRRVAAA